MKIHNQLVYCLYLSATLFSYNSTTSASGFRLPEYTAAGVATANALVADDSRLSAVAYNPAIMAIYSSSTNPNDTNLFSGSMVHVNYETEV